MWRVQSPLPSTNERMDWADSHTRLGEAGGTGTEASNPTPEPSWAARCLTDGGAMRWEKAPAARTSTRARTKRTLFAAAGEEGGRG
jgi:hypothetical protein